MIASIAAVVVATAATALSGAKPAQKQPDNFPVELRESPKKKGDGLFWLILFEALLPTTLIGAAVYAIIKIAFKVHGIK